MTKRMARVQTALFLLFLFGFGAVGILLPDRDFSPMENRNLQTMPDLSWSALLSGEFEKKFETYLSDQFVLRDAWIAIKSGAERLSGKRENNGVYFAARDTLIERVAEPDSARVEANIAAVNRLASRFSVPTYFTLIPTAACVWADRLPTGAPSADQELLIRQINEQIEARVVDTLTPLLEHAEESLYYRTDHHWTSLGAYYGAAALSEALGRSIPAQTATRRTVSENFYGTLYSSSGARWVAPDEIWLYVPEDGVTVTGYEDGEPVAEALYDYEKLEGKDQYALFLGGNQPLVVIRGPQTDAPKALILRDSYADSEIPFLLGCFSEIHAVDPRYYRADIVEYAREAGVDVVLISYGVKNFVEDGNLPFFSKRGA